MLKFFWRWPAPAWVVMAITCSAAAAQEGPSRIVSINLCADEMLLTLADPDQIAALSIYATDRSLSFLAAEAARFRHDAADAETVIDLDPDLVLAGRFTKHATRLLLTELGYRVEVLDPARSIEASLAQIRRVAAMVGHPERGESLAAAIEAARLRVVARASVGEKTPSAAVYQRRGYVSGAETLTGELLDAVGFVDGAAALTGASGGFVPLERLVATPPDALIVATAAPPAEDQGSALLSHPALARLFPPHKRIVLPQSLTVCGGPSLPEALDRLAAEAERFRAGR